MSIDEESRKMLEKKMILANQIKAIIEDENEDLRKVKPLLKELLKGVPLGNLKKEFGYLMDLENRVRKENVEDPEGVYDRFANFLKMFRKEIERMALNNPSVR